MIAFGKRIAGITPQMIEYIVKFYEMRASCTNHYLSSNNKVDRRYYW